MKKPNFFLIGIQRCGTTAWYEYLKQHPEVFMSEVKGPNYFGEYKNSYSKYYDTENKYLKLFKSSGNKNVVGEASHLFHSTYAPSQIKKFNKNSKFIIILRDPIEMFRSVFDTIKIENFEEVLELLKTLSYDRNLKRWFQYFDREQIHIIIFEDFLKNPDKEYSKVCRFLGIDSSFKPKFEKINASKKSNYPLMIKFLISLWRKISSNDREKVKRLLGNRKKVLVNFYQSFDKGKESSTKISKSDRKIIREDYFEKMIVRTEKILNLKLDVWREK